MDVLNSVTAHSSRSAPMRDAGAVARWRTLCAGRLALAILRAGAGPVLSMAVSARWDWWSNGCLILPVYGQHSSSPDDDGRLDRRRQALYALWGPADHSAPLPTSLPARSSSRPSRFEYPPVCDAGRPVRIRKHSAGAEPDQIGLLIRAGVRKTARWWKRRYRIRENRVSCRLWPPARRRDVGAVREQVHASMGNDLTVLVSCRDHRRLGRSAAVFIGGAFVARFPITAAFWCRSWRWSRTSC